MLAPTDFTRIRSAMKPRLTSYFFGFVILMLWHGKLGPSCPLLPPRVACIMSPFSAHSPFPPAPEIFMLDSLRLRPRPSTLCCRLNLNLLMFSAPKFSPFFPKGRTLTRLSTSIKLCEKPGCKSVLLQYLLSQQERLQATHKPEA